MPRRSTRQADKRARKEPIIISDDESGEEEIEVVHSPPQDPIVHAGAKRNLMGEEVDKEGAESRPVTPETRIGPPLARPAAIKSIFMDDSDEEEEDEAIGLQQSMEKALELSARSKALRIFYDMVDGERKELDEVCYYRLWSAKEEAKKAGDLDRAEEIPKPEGPAEMCSICFTENVELVDLWVCGNGHTMCRGCVAAYIREQFSTPSKLTDLTCPECDSAMGGTDVEAVFQAVGDDDSEKRFHELVMQLAMANIRQCPKCDLQFDFDQDEVDDDARTDVVDERWKVECPGCGEELCGRCRNVQGKAASWHAPKSCDKYSAEVASTDKNEAALLEFLKKKGWKRCPHCGTGVEKTKWCNWIKCHECKKPFCYLCGQKVPNTDDHYAHFSIKGTPCFGKIWK